MSFFTRSHEDRWYARKIGPTVTLAIQTPSVGTSNLATGLYRVIGTADCHLVQASGLAATTSSFFLPANTEVFMQVDGTSDSTVAGAFWPGPGTQQLDATGGGRLPPQGPLTDDDRQLNCLRAVGNGTLYITRVSDLGSVTADA